MRRIANWTLWTAALAGSLIVLPTIVGVNAVAEGEPPGQQAFVGQKCNMCHAVSTAGIEAKVKSEAMKGPDLTGVGGRYDTETLADYVRKEKEIDGKLHKQDWKGTAEELDALLAWLRTQKAD